MQQKVGQFLSVVYLQYKRRIIIIVNNFNSILNYYLPIYNTIFSLLGVIENINNSWQLQIIIQ